MQTPKIFVVIAFGFILTSSVCQANLGETMAQCIARYGNPSPLPDGVSLPSDSPYDSESIFYKDGFAFMTFFSKGVVTSEAILKVDKSAMSDAEKQTLLDSESAGSTWKKTAETDAGSVYTRADGNAIATYMNANNDFLLYTKQDWDAMVARQAKSQNNF